MPDPRPTYEELEARLAVAEDTLDAIRRGEVDALVVRTDQGEQLFTLEGADEFYRVLLEEMPLGVAGLDHDGTILFANPHLGRMLELPLERLLGRSITDFVPADRQAAANAAFARSAGGVQPELAELTNEAGNSFPVAVTLRRLPRGAGASSCLIVGDLSDLQRELAGAHRRYEQVVETASEGVWTTDANDVVTFVNQAMADLLGHTSEDMTGRPVLDFYAEASLPEARDSMARHRAGISDQGEHRLRAADGHDVWVQLSGNPLRDAEGGYAGSLAMATDVTARKVMETRLQDLADHDPLTGLNNRRRLLEELERNLSAAARSDRVGAVVMLDLDNFKVVNDTRGHAAGDLILTTVADTLNTATRATDFVARLGGDEFAILLPEGGEAAAVRVAYDIRARLSDQRRGAPIPVSFGVAVFGAGRRFTADEVLAAADIALYEAKEHGGEQIKTYDGQTPGGLSWVQEIRAAISDDRLVLHGQPIFDLRSGEVVAHEVLVRMVSARGELIPPGAFLPSAERFGLIREIDRWVNARALRLALDGTQVAINLSGHSIGREEILTGLREAIAAGLDPANVVYEVTESVALTNLASARQFAGTLRELGCELALDDFGTGFASFTYLKHIPARYLKIDQEFVRGLTRDETDREVVKSMVGIAHSLGKLTIAEGVEDEGALELLRAYGVDLAQGYHLGRPAPFAPAGRGALTERAA
jgi:diguanylate cyclase (GGDEF)-like protein/PAS domain S-box-containing protein